MHHPRYTRTKLQRAHLRITAAAATLIAILLASWLLLFYYRDNFATHLPARSVIAESWSRGELPLWNPWIGGGQPLGGNPNTLAFYPTGLLQILLPLHVSFNLHFWLHLLGGAVAMRLLARLHGMSDGAATGAAVVYLFSGATVSATSFYNLVTAVALIPLTLVTLERWLRRPDRLRGLQLGAVLGLFGLSSEPMIVGGTAVLMIGLTWGRLTGVHLARAFVPAVVALLVASPQLIAFAEISREVERARYGYSTETVLAASMHWWRLPEWILGPVWGLATDLGATGWSRVAPSTRWPPLMLHLTAPVILVPAVLLGIRQRRWRLLAPAAILLLLALGSSNPLLRWVLDLLPALRIARFPEKLVLHLTVVVALLSGWWLDSRPEQRHPLLATYVAAIAGTFVLLWMYAAGRPAEVLISATGWILLAVLTSLLLAREGSRRSHLILLAVPLLAAWLLSVPLDAASPYVGEKRSGERHRLYARGALPPHPEMTSSREHYRVMSELPVPHFAVMRGVAFALDRSPEGMFSAASRLLAERAQQTSSPELLQRWMRLSSASRLVNLSSVWRGNAHVELADPLPSAWSPGTLIPVSTVAEAVAILESESFVPGVQAVVPQGRDTAVQAADVSVLYRTPGTMRLRVAGSSPGLVVLDQTFFRSWRAVTRDGLALDTLPVNIDRLGILVPPGAHEVEVRFGRWRGLVAVGWGLSLSLLFVALASIFVPFARNQGSTAPAR